MRTPIWFLNFLFHFQQKLNLSALSFLLSKSFNSIKIALLTFIFILFSGLQGYAQIRGAAVVRTVQFGNGDRNMFRLTSSANALSRPIAEVPADQRRIDGEGELLVPNDGESLVSFYFERQDGNSRELDYGGLVVQTRPDRRSTPPTTNYRYPCEFNGQLIIAWRSGQSRMCDNEEDGRIELFPRGITPEDISISQGKRNGTENGSESLAISPGDQGTVIRTTSRSRIEYVEIGENCRPVSISYLCQYINGERVCEEYDRSEDEICLSITEVQTIEAIDIEVLEGDILVQPDINFPGTGVLKGQRYSYPEGTVESFDVNQAAMSCETLRFLNPAYWLDTDTPANIADGITQQLKEHRDSLGISGRPPNNLSSLESSLIEELNGLRSDPRTYAETLEQRKQFYYENWLRLPGETLDQNLRRKAVDEAISFLRSQPNLPEFSVSTGLSMASRDHVIGQGRTGRNFGHTGNNGDGYWDRIRRHGTVAPCGMGENISYYDPNFANNVQEEAQIALVELLVDDGQRQAGERENIFNQDFQVIGVACGPHGNFLREMCDITYANGYLEN